VVLIAIAQIDVKRALSYSVSAYMDWCLLQSEGKRCCFVVGIDSCFGDEPLVMSIGAIIWNNITQDLTQYGGCGRAPRIRLAFVVGAAGCWLFLPGRFWALLKLADGLATQPGLVGVLLVVNALTV